LRATLEKEFLLRSIFCFSAAKAKYLVNAPALVLPIKHSDYIIIL